MAIALRILFVAIFVSLSFMAPAKEKIDIAIVETLPVPIVTESRKAFETELQRILPNKDIQFRVFNAEGSVEQAKTFLSDELSSSPADLIVTVATLATRAVVNSNEVLTTNQEFGHSFEVLPASQQFPSDWYLGTADALYQNKDFIRDSGAKYVMVLAGDHIYKMDYRLMLRQHVSQGSDLSVACIEVPIAEAAGQFGVMNVDKSDRVTSFEEKPLSPEVLEDRPGYTLASMGNYIFDTEFLLEQLTTDAQSSTSEHDFGKNIIPSVLNNFFVQAYRFKDIQGAQDPYWRDVGTIDSYWLANMALLDSENKIDLYDKHWPIWCEQASLPPAKFTGSNCAARTVSDSLISNGCIVGISKITKSLLFTGASVSHEVNVEKCIVLPHAHIAEHCKLYRVIVAHNCRIPAHFEAGFDHNYDRERGLRVSPHGVVLITQSMLDKVARSEKSKKRLLSTSAVSSGKAAYFNGN